ncbi:hypothetical protein RFI_10533 [Reticulomyxa filosa]|uniref:Ion transport domain-containing protein n=1 Tax=Reticulomyxa filosa TaxID=46433 RepID=X6NJW6_RETFI|nr:hypothetical protein RFI_10533 [Reticulomyxa filosa]|eukprot:ETO26605.1 hypothetical protein RFI_10533 [Reticulomyxa filosa]
MGIFTVECVLKIIAFGYRYYFSLNSYRLCVVVVLLGWASTIWNNGVILPFGVLMVFRFVLVIEEFRQIWEVLTWCAPKLFHLIIFAFLILFMFAIFGVSIVNQESHVHSYNFVEDLDGYLDLLQTPTLFFRDVLHAWMLLYLGLAGGGDGWTPALFGILNSFDHQFFRTTIIFYFVIYWVVMVIIIASLFAATLIDYHRDFTKAEEIEKMLFTLNDLKLQWKQEIDERRDEYFRKHTQNRLFSSGSLSMWRDYIDGTNLFETFLPATTLVNMLKSCPPPIGFKHLFESDNEMHQFEIATYSNRIISTSMYRFLMEFFQNLYIPVRKNFHSSAYASHTDHDDHEQSIHGAAAVTMEDRLGGGRRYVFVCLVIVFIICLFVYLFVVFFSHKSDKLSIATSINEYNSWDYVVNFGDVVHSLTWKLMGVDILVKLEENEEFITDWFTRCWQYK